MNVRALLLFALFGNGAGAAALADGDAPPVAAVRSANQLYDAAYDRWKGLAEPPFSTYQASFIAFYHGKVDERRYKAAFRARDRKCLMTGVPIDERDRVEPPQVTDKCAGPDYAFTFVPQAGEGAALLPIEIASAAPSPAASGDMRVIGIVAARSRPYKVADAGAETIDGIRTEHLKLQPYRDPDHYVLRDLWIDPATSAVVQLGGNAHLGVARIGFVADYATRDDAGERLMRVTGYGKAQILLIKAGADFHYEQTAYAFPSALPDAVFDANAKHDAADAPPTALPDVAPSSEPTMPLARPAAP